MGAGGKEGGGRGGGGRGSRSRRGRARAPRRPAARARPAGPRARPPRRRRTPGRPPRSRAARPRAVLARGRRRTRLCGARGRVVGFSARKLREDDPLRAKYVNSPEGELFHKSAILYGLHLARGAIAKEERAVVVEGNTDAIALRQAGLEPVVASMGTALTDRTLRWLARPTRKPLP